VAGGLLYGADWPQSTNVVVLGRSRPPKIWTGMCGINNLCAGKSSAAICGLSWCGWLEKLMAKKGFFMRSLLLIVMSLTLAATGFAQSRGGGGGFRGGARSFAGGAVGNAVRGPFNGGFGRNGGNFGRGFSNRGFVGDRRGFVGVGFGYPGFYAPYYYAPYYDPYYYGAYGYGYPPYGYYGAPVVAPRVVIGPRPGVIVGGGWRRFGWR